VCYRIAGIDIHKKMLAVVVADAAIEGEYEFDRRQFGGSPDHFRPWFHIAMRLTVMGQMAKGLCVKPRVE
jgi:hypothetical protein